MKKIASMTVLVTCAGSMPAVAVIRALKGQDDLPLRVIGTDMGQRAVGFQLADRGAVVPAADHPDYLVRMLDVCARERVEVVFPTIDEEIPFWAAHREHFQAAGIRVVCNAPDVVSLCRDKYATYQFCRENGLPVPPTYLSAAGPPSPVRWPVVIKPRRGRGSIGVFLARNAEELGFFSNYVPDAMIQEWVEGTEYTIDVVTDFDRRILHLVPKRRLEVKAGMQVKGITCNDPQLIAFGEQVASAFGLGPLGNIQCIRTAEGAIRLIEVNPKFATSLPLTVAAGVNIPLLLLKMHLGERPERQVGCFTDGLTMLRHWQEVFVKEADLERRHE
jgi:carbamoyl-phosphate synthase large subunit